MLGEKSDKISPDMKNLSIKSTQLGWFWHGIFVSGSFCLFDQGSSFLLSVRNLNCGDFRFTNSETLHHFLSYSLQFMLRNLNLAFRSAARLGACQWRINGTRCSDTSRWHLGCNHQHTEELQQLSTIPWQSICQGPVFTHSSVSLANCFMG